MNESDWIILLKAIHQKLGKVQQTQQISSRVIFSNTGTVVGLTYATKLDMGEANEEFTWRVSNNQAVLIGYYIKSTDLLTK